jgi:Predicted membrane protein (DUF2232)
MQDSEMNHNPKSIAIGAAAGLAAALLAISASSPNALSLLLLFVTPLPVLLAGLGWGPAAGAASVITGFGLIAALGQPLLAAVCALTITIPAAAMAHFASLGQSDDKGGTHWYPLSGVLIRAIALVSAGFMMAGLLIGYNQDFVTQFVDEIAKQATAANPGMVINEAGKAGFSALLSGLMPYAQPATWLILLIGNFYAALFIARRSDLLLRQRDFWPAALRLPRFAAPAFAVAMALSFLPGGLGDLAAVPAGTLFIALCAVGLALLHGATLGKPWRFPALWATYLAIIVVSLPLIPLFAAGLFSTARREPESTH